MNNSRKLVTPGERILSLREEFGLSRTEFQKKFGVNVDTLKSIELDRRSVTEEKAITFSQIFNHLGSDISPEYILTGEIEKNVSEHVSSYIDDFVIEREIDLIKKISKNLVFMRICDDTMSPIFNYGDIVAGIKINNISLFKNFIGTLCIVETIIGEKILRKVVSNSNEYIECSLLSSNMQQDTHNNVTVKSKYIAQVSRHWLISDLVRG